MTKLLEEAFTMASTGLSRQDQDRLAHFIINNFGTLREVLEDVLDEQRFDHHAIKAFESESVQQLLKRRPWARLF